MTLEDALAECPAVAILRGVTPDEILDHAQALHRAGLRAVEVPLNSPDPYASIRILADAFGDRMAVGAGTVLNPDQVDRVSQAGSRFVISPNASREVVCRALEQGLQPAPGFATATEAFMVIEAGARHLKLFPAVTYGTAHLKQLKAVLPSGVVIWAVGGVTTETMADWWAAGARAFGLGGELYRAGQAPAVTAEAAARAVAVLRELT